MSAERLKEEFLLYADQVRDLHGRIQAGEDPRELPGYRDTTYSRRGLFNVYDLEHGLGMIYADDPDDLTGGDSFPCIVREKVIAMQSALGHNSLEQIVAYSEADPPAIIVKKYGALSLRVASKHTLDTIPLTAYEKLFGAFGVMQSLALSVFDDYRSCIKFASASAGPEELIVTQYYLPPPGAPTTLAEHVVKLGVELTADLRPNSTVPSYAMRYYVACERYLGKEIGMSLAYEWLQRYAVPAINYDIGDE